MADWMGILHSTPTQRRVGAPCPYTIDSGSSTFWDATGIKHVSAHSFRHSYRAWLDELGTPISVQQRAMRHGDIRVTMNVYGDPVNDPLRDASSKVAEQAIGQSLTKSVS